MPKSAVLMLPVVVGIAAGAGCEQAEQKILPGDETPVEFALELDAEQYSHGDTIRLVLKNPTSATVGASLCHADLMRRTEAGWEFAPRSSGQYWACLDVLPLVAPGDSLVEVQPVHPQLSSGIYRFTTEVWIEGDRSEEVAVASKVFRVD